MPQIWDDVNGVSSNIIQSNNVNYLRFKWAFVTFSGENPVVISLRWRKANSYPNGTPLSIRDRIRRDEGQWAGAANYQTTVTRIEDTTTWILSGGQLVPPAESARKYYFTHHVDFPINSFTDGFYIFQVIIRQYTDNTGAVIVVPDNELGYATHRLEINQFDDTQEYSGSSTGQTKAPGFEGEGVYGLKVEVMSEAGVSAESSEVQFGVWETNKYLYDGTNYEAVREHSSNGTSTYRVKRA